MQMRVQGRAFKGASQIEVHRQERACAIMEEDDEDKDMDKVGEGSPPPPRLNSMCRMAPPQCRHAALTTMTTTRTTISCEVSCRRMMLTAVTM